MSRKKAYRPSNWAQYNQSLVQRGRLTLWIDEALISQWYEPCKTGARGASNTYSEAALICALQIGYFYHLTLRATQGFLQSLFHLWGLDLAVPCYTTLSRRLKALQLSLMHRAGGDARHLILDSTGLKVFGEGEWKVRTHGVGKRRTWRKMHIGIDAETQEIVCAAVTTNDFKDSEVFEDCLSQLDPDDLETIRGDGGYDDEKIYDYCNKHLITPLIPPPKNAVIRQHGNSKEAPHPRDIALRAIRKSGRHHWRLNSGYSLRSLVETAMYRFKQAFSGHLQARTFASQAQEVFIKCGMLNRFTQLGLPNSILI